MYVTKLGNHTISMLLWIKNKAETTQPYRITVKRKIMKENNIIPQVGGYLRTIAEVLMAISLCALAFSLFVWMFAIFYMSDTSGLQAFSYVLCSISGTVSSVILLGFSYIVKAAILYLDKNGEFDNNDNIEQTAQ